MYTLLLYTTLLLHAIVLHAEEALFYTQKVATLFCSLVILEVSVLAANACSCSKLVSSNSLGARGEPSAFVREPTLGDVGTTSITGIGFMLVSSPIRL